MIVSGGTLRLPSTGVSEQLESLLVLGAVALAAFLVAYWVVRPAIQRAAAATPTVWDGILADQRVQRRAAWLAPLVTLRVGLGLAVTTPALARWVEPGERVLDAALVIVALLVAGAVASSADRAYSALDISRERPIKGYLQVAVVVAWVIGLVLVVARLAEQDIGTIVAGLGALSAVLLLVFRDTILSLVASINLSQNDLLRVGDWIEMPSHLADGLVDEIALQTVKVSNWDKTMTAIPTYALISQPFKNWRGMYAAGARRIKRSIPIDVGTIRHLSADEIERWRRFGPLRSYMESKLEELERWNAELAEEGSERRLTNIGTFRAYVREYVRAHPRMRADMVQLVRQLEPDQNGLPIEVYAFTDTTVWAEHEGIQSDLFDHLIAMVPEFGLRIHQAPTGADFTPLGR